MTTQKYKCRLCGRNKFDRPYQPHLCRGGFRKNFKKATIVPAFVEITTTKDEARL